MNSGDCVTVLPEGTTKERKIFLASIRAPNLGNKGQEAEPWAFEAKEYVRKLIIGKKVSVNVDFSKEIEVKNGPNAGTKRTMEFGTILNNGKNISVSLLNQGFAKTNLQMDAAGDFKALLDAEKKATTDKKGLHSKKNRPSNYQFADTTQNIKQAKTVEGGLISQGRIDAVVEYVFSGQRFKLRINSENALIAFCLQGVRCPQPDKNADDLTALSNDAKVYSKNQLHQRDVQIEVRHVDKKGNFFGQLWTGSGLYSEALLHKGFAYMDVRDSDNLPEYDELEAAQKEASGVFKGVWAPPVALQLGLETGAAADEDEYGEGPLKGQIIEINNTTSFYVVFDADRKKLAKVEAELAKLDSSAEELKHPVKRGQTIAVRDAEEGKWLRARIEKSSKESYAVFYPDCGSYGEVAFDLTRKLPTALLQYPDLANQCKLGSVRVPKADQPMGDTVLNEIKALAFEKDALFTIIDEDDYSYYVHLSSVGKKQPEQSLNYSFVQRGLAALSGNLSDDYSDWKPVELEAKEEQRGVWEHGGGVQEDY